ncbi:MAG TPA: tetratricopeptide repeat protein [Bacteroidota bacterium]|nr:tetratricopeptide repeat protein [Bacteroidota bacterium]
MPQMVTNSERAGRRRSVLLLLMIFTIVLPLSAQDSKENADFKLAINLFNDRMYDLAAQQFKQFISAYPNTSQSIEARYYLGLVQMQLKQFDDARTTFQNFALSYVEHPRAHEAWLNVGHAFHALGNDKEAALAYERVKVFHPDSPLVPEALLRAGEMRRNLGERDAAKQVLRALIQGYPDSKQVVTARLAIGELYAEEGQLELAEEEARRVSRSDAPDAVRAAALFAIAKFQIGAGLFSNAETTLAGLIGRFAGTDVTPIATVEMGKLEVLTGRAKSAAGRLQALAARKGLDDSLRAEALFHLGAAHENLKQYAPAGDAWDRLIAATPGHPLVLPAGLRAAGAAIADKKFKRALDLAGRVPADAPAPYRERALLLSADASIGLKRPGEASRHLKLFGNEFPDDPRLSAALFRVGETYRRELSDCKNALRIFEQITEQTPGSEFADDALFAAAVCRQAMGDDADAVATYADLQSRYPANDHFEEAGKAVDFLESHRIKNRDVGIGKLAELLGGVLSEKPTPMLAYQLGEIYFNDLKDYENAAKQFENALRGGLGPEETVTASFMRARSYHLLSEIEPDARATAAELYAKFIEQFPANDWTADAAFFAFRISSASDPYERSFRAGSKFLKNFPDSRHREAVIMSLGELALANAQPVEALRLFRAVLAGSSARTDEALSALGRAFSMNKQPDSASAQWQAVVGRGENPRMSALALSALASDALARKDYQAAAGHMRTLSTEYAYSASGAKASADLPGVLLQAGAYPDVIALLGGRTGAQAPAAPAGETRLSDLFTLAQACDRSGDKEQALARYHLFLRSGGYIDPRASEVYYALGNLARLQGRNDAASAYFREASSRGSGGALSPEIAELLYSSEQYAEAARQFLAIAASSEDPGEQRRASAKAIVATLRLDRVKDADRLIAAFEKKFGKPKNERAEFQHERGMAYFRTKDYTKAKDLFARVADDFGESPQAPWAEFYVAKISELTGDGAKAFEGYREVAKKYPDSDVKPRALLSAGNFHFNAERYEEAIGLYQQITANPDAAGDILPYAMTNLIEAYGSVKLYENALQTTRDFIQRYPNDASVVDKKIRIGTLYSKIGYYDQAIFQFQTLLPEAGSSAEAELRYNIGEAYYSKGEYQQAILEFLKVPYLASGKGNVDWTATSFYMAGQSYEKMMKFDEAVGMYQQVVDRPGIDANFKAAARKEIERVKLLNKSSK